MVIIDLTPSQMLFTVRFDHSVKVGNLRDKKILNLHCPDNHEVRFFVKVLLRYIDARFNLFTVINGIFAINSNLNLLVN